jgi:ribosomal protein S8
MMTHKVNTLLTLLKNAITSRKKKVIIRYNYQNFKLLQHLVEAGLIRGLECVGTTKKERHLIVFLKYDVFLEPAVKEINIISKVERKKTYKKNEMIKYHNLFK